MLNKFLLISLSMFSWAVLAHDHDKFPKTDSLIEEGHKSFHSNCETCHGSNMDANTPMASNLHPKPRNLITDEFKYGDSAEDIVKTITNGIPNTMMVSFKSSIDEKTRWGIAYYILSKRHNKEHSKEHTK